MYILTAHLAYQQEIVSLSRFSQLLFTDIRKAKQIIKTLDEILENSDNTEHWVLKQRNEIMDEMIENGFWIKKWLKTNPPNLEFKVNMAGNCIFVAPG